MKRRKRHTKKLIILLLSIEILIVIGLLAYVQFRPMVVKTVTIEAGSDMPEVNEFLIYKNRKGTMISDMKDINLNVPGDYEIKIKIGKRTHTSNLQVVDTVAPSATISDQMALQGEELDAKAFVTDIKDATTVEVYFKNKPVTTILGDQEVTVVLEDSSYNKTELKAMLTILDIKSTVTIEAGSEMNITVNDFLDNDLYDVSFVTDLSTIDTSKPVIHNIIINVDGREVSANIEVIDTIAPIVTFHNGEIWNDELPPADIFLTSKIDATEVKISYKEPPDLTVLGEQVIYLIAEDEGGNRAEQSVTVTVKEDTQPPEIIGISDKTVYIGESIAYRKGVSVIDNKDQDLKASIDSSDVNLKKEGTYKVVYSAKDKAGNSSTVETKVTVIKFSVSEDTVNELADGVLEDILEKDMTKEDKAYAIYKWVKGHVSYSGYSDKTDWLAEAYRAIEDGEGDCFTYYAVAQALLTRAGIDNMRVTRVGGRTQHFWNLINCGSGWYHFDTCPNKDHVDAFMLTDKEVEAYTEKRGNNYYTFDKSLYPATPEE